MRNVATGLKRSAMSMRRFDRLPPELRRWLHDAALPWSAASAQKLWTRALRRAGGDAAAAQELLDRAQARALARDARDIWGPGHPAARISADGNPPNRPGPGPR